MYVWHQNSLRVEICLRAFNGDDYSHSYSGLYGENRRFYEYHAKVTVA